MWAVHLACVQRQLHSLQGTTRSLQTSLRVMYLALKPCCCAHCKLEIDSLSPKTHRWLAESLLKEILEMRYQCTGMVAASRQDQESRGIHILGRATGGLKVGHDPVAGKVAGQ